MDVHCCVKAADTHGGTTQTRTRTRQFPAPPRLMMTSPGKSAETFGFHESDKRSFSIVPTTSAILWAPHPNSLPEGEGTEIAGPAAPARSTHRLLPSARSRGGRALIGVAKEVLRQ